MNKKTNQSTLRTKPLNKTRLFITKPRNKYGGGVAILIKEGIEFIQDFSGLVPFPDNCPWTIIYV
ncbi:hypothetical protein BpHYR1_004909 [Brachionus plicatilis]|uniref:Uncharacterized protein n=1 Tax=Brachionus plicatilis TaxID=10195 RepID=A0A3M7PJL3_BRAPC|nr:hypothetical protein BpHYR1_004909 [Brachionus plicatilis]